MKKTNFLFLALAILTIFFTSCSEPEKNEEQSDINARNLIGTWRYSRIVDLDAIVNVDSIAASIGLPSLGIRLGEATFNFDWTFNEDRATGYVNAFLLYRGNRINAPDHPRSFEYIATETEIIFPVFPYETFENVYRFTLTLFAFPLIVAFTFGLSDVDWDSIYDNADVRTTYVIEEEIRLTMMFGEFARVDR